MSSTVTLNLTTEYNPQLAVIETSTASRTTWSTLPEPIVTRTFPTLPVSTRADGNSGGDGPSWGLIIPILLIVLFLLCVGFCLYWHKWRDRRSQRDQKDATPGPSSFYRSYRGSRSSRGVDTIRDSTRSTTPLRSSLNEKINSKQNNIKIKTVNVIPIQRPVTGKYAFYWDQNHWKAYPNPATMSSSRHSASRPLSPINEVDSPTSNLGKLSELSKSYDVSAQPSEFSPYHLTWITPNPPPSYEQSETALTQNRQPPQVRKSSNEYDVDVLRGYEPYTNSPFFPNNNTPTTECDVDSVKEGSQMKFIDDVASSQNTSYPSSPTMSRSNHGFSMSPDTDNRSTSVASSYPETSYQPSSRQSGHLSGYQNSGMTSEHFSGNMSLPSSISQFQNQLTVVEDSNNNSIIVPNSYLSYPTAKGLNYTLASSLASSDNTQYSDNTSMLPNVGSHNTTGLQSGLGSLSVPASNEQSGNVSPEDLSKLVDDMSSIRPNSSTEPTARVISISGQSISADFHHSCSNIAEEPRSTSSTATSSQVTSQNEGSFSWDSYPLNGLPAEVRSNPDLPLHVRADQLYRKHALERAPRMSFHAPVLDEKQYWV